MSALALDEYAELLGRLSDLEPELAKQILRSRGIEPDRWNDLKSAWRREIAADIAARRGERVLRFAKGFEAGRLAAKYEASHVEGTMEAIPLAGSPLPFRREPAQVVQSRLPLAPESASAATDQTVEMRTLVDMDTMPFLKISS